MSWAPRALVVTLAVAIAGCGSTAEIDRGGVVLGSTLTVYSLLPDDPALAATAQDIIDGEKVALEQAGGQGRGLPRQLQHPSLRARQRAGRGHDAQGAA